MKKIFKITIALICIATLIGCSPKPDGNGDGTEQLTVSDYFPVRDNTRYIYEGYGNEYAAYQATVDYSQDDKVQQRINNGGTEIVSVFKIAEGKVTKVFSRGETYFRQNFMNEQSNGPEDIILMEPIEEGNSWPNGDSQTTITSLDKEVETPSGNYKALEVTTEGTDGKTISYYAKDIGLVKTIYMGADYEVSSSLSSIEENVPFKQTVRFYYPNIDDEKYYYRDIDIDFMTNDSTGDILCGIYKQLPENTSVTIGKVFSANTVINSMELKTDGMLYLDLNRSFLTEMNAGSGYEGMILQSIANTFGGYFNTDKVILTIDNQLYESGHFAFQEGEYITVNLDNTVKLL